MSELHSHIDGSHDSSGNADSRAGLVVLLIFSGGLFLLLVAVATGVTGRVLPPALASKVGYNSEGYLFALVLTPWVYYVARHPGRPWKVAISLALGVLWLVVGWMLLNSSLPSAIKTLNEPAFALGVVLPYVAVRRPLARWIPLAIAGGILVAIVLGIRAARPEPGIPMESDNWVIYLGEGVFLVLLTVVALDLVERWLLDRGAARLHPVLRALFYATLVMTPVVVSALGRSTRVGDQWHSMALNYLGRVHEAFVGTLLVCGALVLVSWCERRSRLGYLAPTMTNGVRLPDAVETLSAKE